MTVQNSLPTPTYTPSHIFLRSLKSKQRQNKKQIGRSMIEMLGVLAIVGILSAGGIAGYFMAMEHHKTNAFVEKVNIIAMQARALYKGDYTGSSIDALIRAGLIKDKTNPFGGNFYLAKQTGKEHFYITTTLYSIPVDACVKIVTADYGSESWVSIATQVGNQDSWAGYTPDMTVAQVISACKGGNKKIHWNFK